MKELTENSMDVSKIDNVVIADKHSYDHPEYCDAYILSADYDGRKMSDEEIDNLPDDVVHDLITNN